MRKFTYIILVILITLTAGCSSSEKKIKGTDIDRWVIEQDGTITDHTGKTLKGYNLFEPINPNEGPLFSDIKELYGSYVTLHGLGQVPPPQPLDPEYSKREAGDLTVSEFKQYHIDIESGDIINNKGMEVGSFRVRNKEGKSGYGGFLEQVWLMFEARRSLTEPGYSTSSNQNSLNNQNQQAEQRQSEPINKQINEMIELPNGLVLTITDFQYDSNNKATMTVKVNNQSDQSRSFIGHFGYQTSTQEYLNQFDLTTTDLGDILPGKTVDVSYITKNSIKDKDIQALTLDTRSIKGVMKNPTLPYEYLITLK